MRFLSLAIAACCAPLGAQQVVWVQTGFQDKIQLGGPIAFLGDLDLDGYPDLAEWGRALVHPTSNPRSLTAIRSGRDGRILELRPGPELCWDEEEVIELGDIDADGIRDYARRWPDSRCNLAGVIACYSGRTGKMLWWVQGQQFQDWFGWPAVGDLDLNGDGRPDLLAYAPGEVWMPGWRGVLRAFDHRGALLFRMNVDLWPQGGLGKMGDLDRDGHDDFVLATAIGRTTDGVVHVYSGRTRQILVSGYGERPDDRLGSIMARGCGDVDRDGVLDFMALSHGFMTNPNFRVFSGKDGSPIHSWRETEPGRSFGGYNVAVADFDRDGVLDFAVRTGDYATRTPRIDLLSGRDGRVIGFIPRPGDSPYWPGYVFRAPERPDSPFPPLVVNDGAYGNSNTPLQYVGRQWMYLPIPSSVSTRGTRCAGAAGPGPWIGWRALGPDRARIHLSGAPPGGHGVLLLGLSTVNWGGYPLPIPLDLIGLSGCLLHNSVDLFGVLPIGLAGIDRGCAALELPAGPKLPKPLHAQWITLDATGNVSGASASLTWR